jgi:hypothetical protein
MSHPASLPRSHRAFRTLAIACAIFSSTIVFAQSSASSSQSKDLVRTIPLKNGEVQIERQNHASVHADDGSVREQGGMDMVTVVDASGTLVSESACHDSTGRYDEYHAHFKALIAAIKANDAAHVATLVHYPLRVNRSGQRPLMIANAAALKKKYASVFSAETQKAIIEAEPANVFCRNGSAMMGHGVVWAQAKSGRVALFVVNPAAR